MELDDEPSGSAFLYMDVYAGVGFPHWLVTRPGLGLEESHAVVQAIHEFFDEIAEQEELEILVATVSEEGIARQAVGMYDWAYLGTGATLYRKT